MPRPARRRREFTARAKRTMLTNLTGSQDGDRMHHLIATRGGVLCWLNIANVIAEQLARHQLIEDGKDAIQFTTESVRSVSNGAVAQRAMHAFYDQDIISAHGTPSAEPTFAVLPDEDDWVWWLVSNLKENSSALLMCCSGWEWNSLDVNETEEGIVLSVQGCEADGKMNNSNGASSEGARSSTTLAFESRRRVSSFEIHVTEADEMPRGLARAAKQIVPLFPSRRTKYRFQTMCGCWASLPHLDEADSRLPVHYKVPARGSLGRPGHGFWAVRGCCFTRQEHVEQMVHQGANLVGEGSDLREFLEEKLCFHIRKRRQGRIPGGPLHRDWKRYILRLVRHGQGIFIRCDRGQCVVGSLSDRAFKQTEKVLLYQRAFRFLSHPLCGGLRNGDSEQPLEDDDMIGHWTVAEIKQKI